MSVLWAPFFKHQGSNMSGRKEGTSYLHLNFLKKLFTFIIASLPPTVK